jgi:site-specific DNA-methyltransferase (adenine-specific)
MAASKKIKISDIKLNPNNPRLIKDEKFQKLVKSIKEFPEMLEIRPIVVNSDMIILGGNMRYKACKEAGLKELPVIIANNLTEEQQKEFLIKDNTSGGEWDFEKLINEWDVAQLEEWGLDVPSFDVTELEAEEDDFDSTPPEEPKTVLGDLYEIGEHRLLCGDSTQTDSYVKLFNGLLADIVVTDPPYNVDYQGGTGLKIMNDKMSDEKFYNFLYDFYTAMNTFVKKGGVWYVWHADIEGANFRMAMKNAGIKLRQCLIWVKSSIVLGRQDYHWKHEPCLYGWKDGTHHWYNDRKQSTVLNFDKPKKNGEHPTMKPVELIAYQIKNNSKIGEIVSDGFLGSGTTMVASHQLKRKCYGMELDTKYCDVIVKRMITLDPNLTVKLNGVDVTKDWK